MQGLESTRELPSVEQGLELLRAFMEISDPHLRREVLALALAMEARSSAQVAALRPR